MVMNKPSDFAGAVASLALAATLAVGSASAAVITVDTLADSNPPDYNDGLCSLREALESIRFSTEVGGCVGGTADEEDRIVFDSALIPADPQDPFVLLLEDDLLTAFTGEWVITGPTTRRLTIDAGLQSEVFRLSSATSVTLENLELTRGAGGQGAINLGEVESLTLRDMWFTDSEASDRGGAVGGNPLGVVAVTIEDSWFSGNSAGSFGGAVGIATGGPNARITLTIRNSRFEGNQTGQFGAGGAVYAVSFQSGGQLTLDVAGSSFVENVAGGDGGAVAGVGLSTVESMELQVRGNLFRNNVAQGGSGGGARLGSATMVVENNTFLENLAESDGGGLELSNFSSQVDFGLRLNGNTFFANRSQGIAGNAEQATIQLHPTVDSDNVVRGNLLVNGDTAQFDACFIQGLAFADEYGFNLSNSASCVVDPDDLLVDDVRASVASTGEAAIDSQVALQPGSPAIDFWPAEECGLTADMLGRSRPVDGDDAGDADCDAGASEAPEGVLLRAMVDSGSSGSGEIVSVPFGIVCPPDCDVAYPLGSEVTLVATAATGSAFNRWQEDCNGQEGPCILTMSEIRAAIAEFNGGLQTGVVNVSVSGPGVVLSDPSGVYCQPQCSAPLPRGTARLMAVADVGAAVTWSEACAGTVGNLCEFNVREGLQVSANFAETDFELAVTLSGTGAGSVASTPDGISCPAGCAATFPAGTTVTLNATALPGDVFAGWTGDCEEGNPGTGPCTVTLDAAQTINAEFQRRVPLNLTVTGNGTVSSSPGSLVCSDNCSEDFDQFTVVTLNAVPDPGWRFVEWQGCGSSVNLPLQCSIQVFVETNVDAVFEPMSDSVFANGFESP